MICSYPGRSIVRQSNARRAGFTLIELLVVVSIIALLVSILVPSLTGARRAAKNTKTLAIFKTLDEGAQLFRADNEKQYRQTNGYPASHRAEDLATTGTQDIMGAQWLVRSLLGADMQGFIPRRIVPRSLQNREDKTDEQVRWYQPQPNDPPIDRIATYVSLDRVTVTDRAIDLSPVPPEPRLWKWCVANCDKDFRDRQNPRKLAPVFMDPFGGPILYYAANAYGTALCVTQEDDRSLYKGTQKGYYTHEDNIGFTGRASGSGGRGGGREGHGWLLKQRKRHLIEVFGPSDFKDIDDGQWSTSFAHYIHDHSIEESAPGTQSNSATRVIKPFNADSYLLISAGEDGVYGSSDDVKNFGR